MIKIIEAPSDRSTKFSLSVSDLNDLLRLKDANGGESARCAAGIRSPPRHMAHIAGLNNWGTSAILFPQGYLKIERVVPDGSPVGGGL